MKHYLLKTWLIVVCLLAGVGTSWAETKSINGADITGFGSGTSYTQGSYDAGNGITISSKSGFSTSQFRVAKSNDLTISISNGKITAVEITVSSNSYKLNASNLSYSSTVGSYSNATGVSSVVFTNSNSNIARITEIKITYTADGGNSGDGGDSGSGSGDTPTPTPSASAGYFVKITSAADIVDGGQYLIVREESTTQYAAGINEGTSTYLSINEFATTGYYYGEVNASGKPYVYTLTADANNAGYYFLTNGDKYLNAASSGTNLTLDDKSNTGYSDWSIEYTIQKNVNIANKSALSGGSGRLIKYNTGSPARFAAYASSTGSTVTLYRYVPSVAVSSAGYATYYNEFSYVMPEGLEGKIMEFDKEDNVVSSVAFAEGNVVPANTALLLKGSERVYPLLYTNAAPDEIIADYCTEYNLLHGRLTEGTTEGEGKHYKFTRDTDGLGWYYGAEGGAPFTIAANKAYLVVPNSAQSARFISIDGSTLTGIEGVNTDVKNTEIYDLSGRRVNRAANGIYILGGKKVIF